MAAVTACKWTNLPVPGAPYVTSPEWMDLYGTRYVVHGDDITTDSSGEDCYRIVKAAGRFKLVKRTPGISTTDLVGRMLLCTKTHHIRDLGKLLLDQTSEEGRELLERTKMYASDSFGVVGKGSTVYNFIAEQPGGKCVPVVSGVGPKPGQRVVYVDGGFDLFSSGHIEFLKRVMEREKEEGHEDIYVVAGVHDDRTINQWKGLNYPIMNMFERGLCVLQCRVCITLSLFTVGSEALTQQQYINSIILTAPFSPTKGFLEALPTGVPSVVYHGPTTFMPGDEDPYVISRNS